MRLIDVSPQKPWKTRRTDAGREDILRETIALVRLNFPTTLIASLASAAGTVWVMQAVADRLATMAWMVSHVLIVACVYGVLLSLDDHRVPPRVTRLRLVCCMAALGVSWGSLSHVVLHFGNEASVIYAIGIISTVSSGALGLGAPVFWGYVAYLTCALGGAALAIALTGGAGMWPSLAMMCVYYALTCTHARTSQAATLRSIEIKLENERLVAELRAQSRRALAAQEAAQKADRDKSRFLAAASHDLRQPLHALGLFLETLQRGPLTQSQRGVLGHAQTASGAAAEMLSTLLDYSRLEAGVVKAQPGSFAIQPMLTALEQEFGGQADACGLVYRTRETTAAAFADRSLVILVMHNLISNALRYTHQGGVLIACRRRGTRLALEVWDTGVGIPKHQHDAVFQEFHQLGNPERDRRKGLGLGLAIVQRLASEMGTTVEVRSQPNKGSVFRLWLNAWQGALEDESPSVTEHYTLNGIKVFAIDDDETVRLGMQSLLESWGCRCLTADSGEQAQRLLQAMEPDLIITDYRLRNDTTGKHLLHTLRTDMGRMVPAILLTGDTSPDRLRDAQSTNALLLHKPVSTNQLRDAMVQLLQSNSQPSHHDR